LLIAIHHTILVLPYIRKREYAESSHSSDKAHFNTSTAAASLVGMAISILAVAEKPSVAREMAHIIGADNARPRQVGASRLFEVSNCDFQGRRANMTITAVAGHFFAYDFHPDYKVWDTTPQESLFTCQLIQNVKEGNESLKSMLVAEARRNQILFLWLDCDLGKLTSNKHTQETFVACNHIVANVFMQRVRLFVTRS